MKPTVNISVTNGNLGKTFQTADGVCGLITTGVTVVNTPLRITSVANAISQGITEAAEAFAYKQVVEYYSEAGEGAVLYLLLRVETVTMAQMVDYSHASSARALLDFATEPICLLGVSRNPTGETSVPANFVRADVIAAITGSTSMIANYRTAYKPFRMLLEGRTDVTSNVPQDLKAMTNNGASVVLGGTANDGHASVGLALGRLAKLPVQRCIGRVKDGALAITTAFIGTTKVDNFAAIETAIDKGFITIRNYVGRTGYYFSDDPTASLPTDDFTNLANGRVIDKAYKLAYQVYLEELNNEVEIATDGKMDAGICKFLEGKIEQTIRQAMVGEISSFDALIDPDQNVLATGKVKIKMSIIPVGYSKIIEIELGFTNPY
jgi:hypothetical protein